MLLRLHLGSPGEHAAVRLFIPGKPSVLLLTNFNLLSPLNIFNVYIYSFVCILTFYCTVPRVPLWGRWAIEKCDDGWI